MNVIWKHKIVGTESEFEAPAGTQAISALVQGELDGQQPVLYLCVDPEMPRTQFQAKLIATGQRITETDLQFVNTIVLEGPGGPVPVHVFFRQLGVVTSS